MWAHYFSRKLLSDEEQLLEWKKVSQLPIRLEEKCHPWIFRRKDQALLDRPAHKKRPEEESCGAKSKSGWIISGWSFDKCGFLFGMLYSCVSFDVCKQGQRPSSPRHWILGNIPWCPASLASSPETFLLKGASPVVSKVKWSNKRADWFLWGSQVSLLCPGDSGITNWFSK